MGLFNERLRSLDISLGIGETSRVTGATPTQIRYWEKKHLIQSHRHEANGNKRYSLSNIALIVMIKTMLDEGYTLAKASEEIEKSHQKADMLHVLMSTRLQGIQYDDHQTFLNFGPLENDPSFDVIAVVQENTAKLYKKAIQPPMPPHQGSLPENKDDTGRSTL
ncbi:MerR family transcriptional regulator [Lacticaseibacillus zeae DSM 20178 = KCTC 3804]|uniref:MerR family transcriptional regulator n=2 Tax=Lacticaseibacillus zeae TaxID=57037 RepID=A0A5R8M183_LACZE|nr:MerR family transcriptional regulator [Lacticaseibacillus zeae]KRK11860.1 MerR family transcriptional regulator [Lacticaseibacillus zeae DSM 20178 = KCTC 3804]QVI32789.1 MerR family transcriptional regulator [Lacticaseibacillus zeae]TLF43323.1 MerR family transcriptional regulator [Lacticaseibacillus zeae]